MAAGGGVTVVDHVSLEHLAPTHDEMFDHEEVKERDRTPHTY